MHCWGEPEQAPHQWDCITHMCMFSWLTTHLKFQLNFLQRLNIHGHSSLVTPAKSEAAATLQHQRENDWEQWEQRWLSGMHFWHAANYFRFLWATSGMNCDRQGWLLTDWSKMAQARLLIHGRYFPAVFEHGRNSVLGDGILSAYLRWPRSLLSGTSCSFLAWQPAGTTRVLSIWVCMLLLYTLVGESEFVNIKMFVQPHLTQNMGGCL